MNSIVSRILRLFHVTPVRAGAIILLAAALAPLGFIFERGGALAQNVLPNGVALPPEFLQPKAPTQAFRQPTYLSNPPAVIPINIGRQLFVDDFLIEATSLQRTAHRPTPHAGNPVLSPGGADVRDSAFPFSDGVWYDPDSRLFKMWYYGGNGNNVAYATSTDGRNWVKPTIPDAAVPNSNLVINVGGGRDSDTVWRDAFDPDPARRYKAFTLFNVPQFNIYFSGDGIHWSGPQPNNLNSLSDRTTIFYNPFRGVWVESARLLTNVPAAGGAPQRDMRVRYYAESRDLVNWTNPAGVFWVGADELDPPYVAGGALPELYNLDAVAYESLMVGLFSWFHPGPDDNPKFADGPDLVELGVGFSRDGYQWVRPTRGSGPNAFIAASNVDGKWDCCNTQSAGGGFLVVGDQLWFYYSARSRKKPASGTGSTGLAMLRRDGFYSMDAPGFGGTLTTRPVMFSGSHLFVNAGAAGGGVQAEVLDTSGNVIAPFSRANSSTVAVDTTRSEITWAGASLAAVANRAVKIRFYVTSASLYSFWVTPSAAGASFGYIAAGGPGLAGATDVDGSTAAPPPTPLPAPSPAPAPAPAPTPVPAPAPPSASGESVSMTSPPNGSVVSGVVTLAASATGVRGVVFRIDGGNVGPLILSPPYQFVWNTAPWWNGTHTVAAVAVDAGGNVLISNAFAITTANGDAAPVAAAPVASPPAPTPPPPPPPAGGSGASLFPSSATPARTIGSPTATVGVKFRSDVAGSIAGIRFYKGSGNNGTHIGVLFSEGGALLAQAAFANETDIGWQQVNFASPVPIAANTVYVAALFSTSGFSLSYHSFDGGFDAPPLHAQPAGQFSPNGVYVFADSPALPRFGSFAMNYWVDVVFR